MSEPYLVSSQPVVLNYRFRDPKDSQNVERQDIELVQCLFCGLVFNTKVDKIVPYDDNYDNRQTFSESFAAYQRDLIQNLDRRYSLRQKSILELGCGKGDFLTKICQTTFASGTGYDTCVEQVGEVSPNLRFVKGYLAPGMLREKFDIIICRHVIEHVPQVSSFLNDLWKISVDCGEPTVILETPALDWIVEKCAFWDIFYEHCNYFSFDCLRQLCIAAGFVVLRQERVFDEQYQIIELLPRPGCGGTEPVPVECSYLDRLRIESSQKLGELETAIQTSRNRGTWALWGGGAKGVTLANRLNISPEHVVDSNPCKQGCYIPGTDIKIIAPDSPEVIKNALIVVSNSNYLNEISKKLTQLGYNGKILGI